MLFSSPAMPSVTRSSRVKRHLQLLPATHTHTNTQAAPHNTHTRTRNKTSALQQIHPLHQKRHRDDSDRIIDTLKSTKRQRLTIELSPSLSAKHHDHHHQQLESQRTELTSMAAPPRRGPRTTPIIVPDTTTGVDIPGRPPLSQPPRQSTQPPKNPPPPDQRQQRHHQQLLLQQQQQTQLQENQPLPQQPSRDPPAVETEQTKIKNGRKHDPVQLPPTDTGKTVVEGRKLRSQETVRFKSDLAAYFPDYDEVIGNETKPKHILDVDVAIVLAGPPALQPPSNAEQDGIKYHNGWAIRGYGDALFTELCDSHDISFSFMSPRNTKGEDVEDPLPDSCYEPAHRKAERAERSIRNSERGRAQHEKEQIIRLLDGLQGPDWLRTMGVSGVTESRKKTYIKARDHFIKGCEAILEKFRKWSEEEKRRKTEKVAQAEAARLENGKSLDMEKRHRRRGVSGGTSSGEETPRGHCVNDSEDESDGGPPNDSDVDAYIAKQLREEAIARSRVAPKKAPRRPRKVTTSGPTSAPGTTLQRPLEPCPRKPFKSFFTKKWQRDAALGKNRSTGRTVLAWGHPLPDMAETDFDLPSEFRDGTTLRSNARRRRADRWGNRH